jgi:hypothetical protein
MNNNLAFRNDFQSLKIEKKYWVEEAFKCLKCGNIAFNVDNFLTKYYAKKGGKHE